MPQFAAVQRNGIGGLSDVLIPTASPVRDIRL